MPRPELLEQIYTIVDQIPAGRVTTYGRIAKMTEGATARMVGSAMRHLPEGHQLPWHHSNWLTTAARHASTKSCVPRASRSMPKAACRAILFGRMSSSWVSGEWRGVNRKL